MRVLSNHWWLVSSYKGQIGGQTVKYLGSLQLESSIAEAEWSEAQELKSVG